jgi:hypothetical protein
MTTLDPADILNHCRETSKSYFDFEQGFGYTATA